MRARRKAPDEEIIVLPHQYEFLRYAGKLGGIRGGVGSGKTSVCAIWMLQRMLDAPRGTHAIVAADYPQAKRGFLTSFRALLDRHQIGYSYRSADGTIRLDKIGATLIVLSAELADRIRSVELDSVLLEEPQTWQGDAASVYRTVVGRLRGSPGAKVHHPRFQPQLRMSFNPPAVGSWLYEIVEHDWPRSGYQCWQYSVRDNHLLGDRHAEYVELLEATYHPDQWPVEIDGEWAQIGGDVYRGYEAAVHAAPPSPLPQLALDPNRPILWALDFNVGWMASVVCQIYAQRRTSLGYDFAEARAGKVPQERFQLEAPGWQREIVYCLDEIFLADSGTPDVVAEFVRRYGDIARRSGVYLYGDPAGGARAQAITSHAAARSNWAIVLDGLLAAYIPVTMCVRTYAPPVMDRINAVRAQFRSGEGFGFAVDAARCPNLIADFQGVRYKRGTNEIDKDNTSAEGRKRTHLSDALGYLIDVHRRVLREERIEFQSFQGR